jgi:hypothetical protein
MCDPVIIIVSGKSLTWSPNIPMYYLKSCSKITGMEFEQANVFSKHHHCPSENTCNVRLWRKYGFESRCHFCQVSLTLNLIEDSDKILEEVCPIITAECHSQHMPTLSIQRIHVNVELIHIHRHGFPTSAACCLSSLKWSITSASKDTLSVWKHRSNRVQSARTKLCTTLSSEQQQCLVFFCLFFPSHFHCHKTGKERIYVVKECMFFHTTVIQH